MVTSYTPDKGDFIWLDFNPDALHKQAGKRHALVISPKAYNALTGLCLALPITNQKKGYPFEVCIVGTENPKGVILADYVKSLDWKARNAKFIIKAHRSVVDEAIKKLQTLL